MQALLKRSVKINPTTSKIDKHLVKWKDCEKLTSTLEYPAIRDQPLTNATEMEDHCITMCTENTGCFSLLVFTMPIRVLSHYDCVCPRVRGRKRETDRDRELSLLESKLQNTKATVDKLLLHWKIKVQLALLGKSKLFSSYLITQRWEQCVHIWLFSSERRCQNSTVTVG